MNALEFDKDLMDAYLELRPRVEADQVKRVELNQLLTIGIDLPDSIKNFVCGVTLRKRDMFAQYVVNMLLKVKDPFSTRTAEVQLIHHPSYNYLFNVAGDPELVQNVTYLFNLHKA